MNSAIFCLSLLICSLSSAQDDRNMTEDCHVDTCELLKEFGALRERFPSLETRPPWHEIRQSECETRLRNIENTLTDFEKRVEAVEQNGQTEVIFSAVTGGDDDAIGPFDTDTTLIFHRVITNVGEAYNQYTGVFTAPVAGVYYFTFFCHAGGYYPTFLYLYKNDEPVVVVQDHWTWFDKADNGGNAVFLRLQRYDRVYVVMVAGSHVWDSPFHTTFSGFLVTAMW